MATYLRVKSDPATLQEWSRIYTVNGVYQSTTPVSHSYVPRVMRGVGTVNFHSRKRNGELIQHTPFFQEEQSVDLNPTPYYQVRASDNQVKTYSALSMINLENLTGNGHIALPDVSRAPALVQRAAADIANAGWDAGTFLSEIPSLRRMFRGVAKKINDLASPRKRAQLSSKDLHRAWLESRYGWRTLAYDIRDFNEAIGEFDRKFDIWTKKTGYSYDDQDDGNIHTVNWVAGSFSFFRTRQTHTSIRGAVAVKIRPNRFIVDPLQTGWEVIPYSFVVDWVYNVGQALAVRRLMASTSGTTASYGSVQSSSTSVTCTVQSNPGYEMDFSEVFLGSIQTTERSLTDISIKPMLTGRATDPAMLLDLQALSRTRARL